MRAWLPVQGGLYGNHQYPKMEGLRESRVDVLYLASPKRRSVMHKLGIPQPSSHEPHLTSRKSCGSPHSRGQRNQNPWVGRGKSMVFFPPNLICLTGSVKRVAICQLLPLLRLRAYPMIRMSNGMLFDIPRLSLPPLPRGGDRKWELGFPTYSCGQPFLPSRYEGRQVQTDYMLPPPFASCAILVRRTDGSGPEGPFIRSILSLVLAVSACLVPVRSTTRGKGGGAGAARRVG